jgi:hypothetical protein
MSTEHEGQSRATGQDSRGHSTAQRRAQRQRIRGEGGEERGEEETHKVDDNKGEVEEEKTDKI